MVPLKTVICGNPPGPDQNGPGSEEDWYRNEGLLTPTFALLRESSNIRLLKLSDGSIQWKRTSPTPVVSVQIIGDLVVIGADRINALSLGAGGQQWQAPERGARIAGSPDGRVIIAAAVDAVTAFDADGNARWRTEFPSEFAAGGVDRVSTDEHTAYVTFRPRDERRGPLGVDVLAIALDDKAVRR